MIKPVFLLLLITIRYQLKSFDAAFAFNEPIIKDILKNNLNQECPGAKSHSQNWRMISSDSGRAHIGHTFPHNNSRHTDLPNASVG